MDAFPILQLPDGLLDCVAGGLELWDLAAARSTCRALRAAAGRRARRLVFSPANLMCERGADGWVQVGPTWRVMGGRRLPRRLRGRGTMQSTPLCVAAPPPPDVLSECRGTHAPARPCTPPCPQKGCPTSFQMFPNAREIELQPRDKVHPKEGESLELRLDVPGLFRPPGAPADAAAARAALAGVTRLEVLSDTLEPAELAAALLHLPGLRAVSLLACDELEVGERGVDAFGSDLLAALAGCPRLESLEWDLAGWLKKGAPGSSCTGDGRGPV
jgi:hypothetical protein